ncbi:GNAT family protein [Vibrio sp. FNV 38]|nr:GNAT family protein [Vibrio sp. FNV 38]
MTLVTRRTLLLPYNNELRNEFIMLHCYTKYRPQMAGPHNVASAKKMFDTMLSDDSVYSVAVVQSSTNQYIGHIFIAELNSAPRLGFIFDKAIWGEGLASEALLAFYPKAIKHLGLKQVHAKVELNQPAAEKVLAKLGFALSGQSSDDAGHYHEFIHQTTLISTSDVVVEQS